MIPAEQIEKVEFMLSTPARYHVRGASLNIITKRHKGNKHFSGQVQGGYTQSKYAAGEAKGNILYSNNKLTIDASYSYTNINAYAEAEHEAHHPLNNEKLPITISLQIETKDIPISIVQALIISLLLITP